MFVIIMYRPLTLGDSMSAAARPKRWDVFRYAKGREFDTSRVELFTLLT
jgi:hypothetical protein